jgi:hypothetical protein
MKKITLFIACLSLISLASCKKDRKCECTETYTSPSGTVTTDPAPEVITIKKVTKRDAKSLCQKETGVSVGSSGSTSTDVNDCKLK